LEGWTLAEGGLGVPVQIGARALNSSPPTSLLRSVFFICSHMFNNVRDISIHLTYEGYDGLPDVYPSTLPNPRGLG
jgi:hypothetical protein